MLVGKLDVDPAELVDMDVFSSSYSRNTEFKHTTNQGEWSMTTIYLFIFHIPGND